MVPSFTLDPNNLIRTTYTYDQWGNPLTTTDPDANDPSHRYPGHTNTTQGSSCNGFTACTAYDGTFEVLPTSSTNVLNQIANTTFRSLILLFTLRIMR